MSVFLGLGSNLQQPADQVQAAITELAKLPGTKISGISPFYLTKPVGYSDQPDFINAVVRVDTELSAYDLLTHCQAIENDFGRIRTELKNGPRALDIDILLYDDLISTDEKLILPHPRMTARAFVLYPLADIDPDLIFPDGASLEELLTNTPMTGIELYHQEVLL